MSKRVRTDTDGGAAGAKRSRPNDNDNDDAGEISSDDVETVTVLSGVFLGKRITNGPCLQEAEELDDYDDDLEANGKHTYISKVELDNFMGYAMAEIFKLR